MKTRITKTLFIVALAGMSIMPTYARGGGFGGGAGHFGGGFGGGHFGGGSFGGGHFGGDSFGGGHFGGDSFGGAGHYGGAAAGGDHYGGAEAGGYHYGGAEAGGYHYGGAEAGGYHYGGAEAGGYDHGAWGQAGALPQHPVQFPTDGGMAGMAGASSTRTFSQQNLSAQGTSVRNSFNNDTFNHYSVNRYGANGYGYGYGHGYGYYGGWNYPGCWCPTAGWSSAAAWTCAGTAALGTFLGLAAIGSDGSNNSTSNVTYQGDTVIVNGQQAIPTVQYYQQAQQLAATPSVAAAADGGSVDQWQPLGVFSLAQPGQTQSTMVYQIAINQNGAVKGNYLNQITGEAAQLQGYLDKPTQRISWTVGNNQSTVYDTTLYNLTQPESTIDIHYGPQDTQQMAFVKLSQPQDPNAPAINTSLN